MRLFGNVIAGDGATREMQEQLFGVMSPTPLEIVHNLFQHSLRDNVREEAARCYLKYVQSLAGQAYLLEPPENVISPTQRASRIVDLIEDAFSCIEANSDPSAVEGSAASALLMECFEFRLKLT